MSTLSLSLYTQALVEATGTGGGGGGIHSLSRATKGQSENPAFLGGSGHDGKATCSFQSACARPVPSNLVRALKKKQQGRVRGGKSPFALFCPATAQPFVIINSNPLDAEPILL